MWKDNSKFKIKKEKVEEGSRESPYGRMPHPIFHFCFLILP